MTMTHALMARVQLLKQRLADGDYGEDCEWRDHRETCELVLAALESPMATQQHILLDIIEERHRQDRLKAEGRFAHTCADAEMSAGSKALCLGEEFGEVCRAVLESQGDTNDRHNTELRKELVQVAAVAVAWLESLDMPMRAAVRDHLVPV